MQSVCRQYENLRLAYADISNQLSLRSEENIHSVQSQAEELMEKLGLFEAANEISNNLAFFENTASLIPISLHTTEPLHANYASNRKVSGKIVLNGADLANKQKQQGRSSVLEYIKG